VGLHVPVELVNKRYEYIFLSSVVDSVHKRYKYGLMGPMNKMQPVEIQRKKQSVTISLSAV